ncbi:ribose-phosphate diphosphokinase [Candidatus Dependentiae bacterium]|nr:ribose-phosphate diphosphokinase [Candidatus Dependentiae bacterium]
MSQKFVVASDSSFSLARAVAVGFEAELLVLETGKFADTEWYVQFENVARLKGASVFVVGQFEHVSGLPISDQFMQVLFLAHQSKLHGADRVVVLFPYLPYARQCRDVKSKFVGLLGTVGVLCNSVGIDSIVACEVHETSCCAILQVPLRNVGCETVWQEVLGRELGPRVEGVCFVSPDEGGVERVKRLAQRARAQWAFVKKRRVAHDQSVAIELQGADVKNKTVVFVDDIIDTGITAVQASEKVLEHGAKRVFGCFVHPVLTPGAIARLETSVFERVWVCDTIRLDEVDLGKKITVVSINNLVVEYVRTVVRF